MSDDGEPPGTAGRPALAVLRGSGLGDIALVVTRYFGGTLLGTGGLVRAYGDAAKAVLAIAAREEKIERRALRVLLPYSAYEQARRLPRLPLPGGTWHLDEVSCASTGMLHDLWRAVDQYGVVPESAWS